MAPTLAFPTRRNPCAEGSSLPRTAKPVVMNMYVRVCVIVFAAVSGLHHGRPGASVLKRVLQGDCAAARSARHHILCGAWCQFMQSAGVPTSLEPICSKVAGAHPVTTAGARADILAVLQDRLLLSDASVPHCCAGTYVEHAAATAGSAAEVRPCRL